MAQWFGGNNFIKIRRGCAQRKGEHSKPCQRRQLRWFPQHQAWLAEQVKLARKGAESKASRKAGK